MKYSLKINKNKMRKTKSVERVEKIVELNGRKYCVFCGMICEKSFGETTVHYIEVVDEKLLKEVYELLTIKN
jgi:hypothetical protein